MKPTHDSLLLRVSCLLNKNSFKVHKKKLSTELSKHVWKLKEANVNFQISWKILKHAASYNPVSEPVLVGEVFHYLQT